MELSAGPHRQWAVGSSSVRYLLAGVGALAALAGSALVCEPRGEIDIWPTGAAVTSAVLVCLVPLRPRSAAVLATALTLAGLWVSAAVEMIVILTLAPFVTQVFGCSRSRRWSVMLPVVSGVATTATAVVLVLRNEGNAGVATVAALWTVAVALTLALVLVERNAQLDERDVLTRALDSAAVEITTASGRAVREERNRIARDLHDSTGHLVTAVSIHAGVARRVLSRQREAASPAVLEAVSTVEEYSKAAAGQVQSMFRALRDDVAEQHAAPTLDSVDAVVDDVRGLGLAVELVEVGDRSLLEVPCSVLACRVVREGLLNVRKHSAASGARVVIRWAEPGIRESTFEVEVLDTGPPIGGTTGSGIGLRGLRERVTEQGGQLDHGARPGGGFRLKACLPLTKLNRRAGAAPVARPGGSGIQETT